MDAHNPWTREERRMLDRMRHPGAVQDFLDSIAYSTDRFARCPRRVLHDRRANCWDGALLAAAALRRAGRPPAVVDLRAVRDDDHVVAVFRQGGFFGAVAKSNCSGLRWREPVYRTLRELVMSYFDDYFNTERERTLRSYSGLFDLSRLDAEEWMTSDAPLDAIAARLDAARHHPLLSTEQSRRLRLVDARAYRAGMLEADDAGLFHAPPRRRRARD